MSRIGLCAHLLGNALNIVDRFLGWVACAFNSRPTPRVEKSLNLGAIVFSEITWVDRPPNNSEVASGRFYCVAATDSIKWSLFRCPCGCGKVVTLSMQSVHQPHWRVLSNSSGRPTLYPSIWRNAGCLSHFWVEDGRVAWCKDTGTQPP